MRVLFIVIDQLPGHWAPGVYVRGSLPPVNVWSYARLGLAPSLKYLVENGVYCFTWNMGVCDTRHGMKYLATGRYDCEPFWTDREGWPYYPWSRDNPGPMGLFEYAQHYTGRIKPAVFTTDHWIAPGYFYTAGYPVALSAYYPDDRMWRDFAAPYLKKRRDWNLVYIYFPLMDSVSYCPCHMDINPHPRASKHAYMLHLDDLIGEVISFLKVNRYWDETYLILASDHGYHAACTVARRKGVKTANWCCDHPPPYDCEIWDFERDEPTGRYSGGPRRTLFLLSGGALEEELRGKVLGHAEIIDVAATIADLIDVPYDCAGRSILKRRGEMISLEAAKSPEKPGPRTDE